MAHRRIAGTIAAVAVTVLLVGAGISSQAQTPIAGVPIYTADGRLQFPADYRRWVFLTAGMDMSYAAGGAPPANSAFDNIFVNPAAFDEFQKTGTWPDKTVLVLEARNAQQNGSINKNGHFQIGLRGIEVHVQDRVRFAGGWGFFFFPQQEAAAVIPQATDCYSCHQLHGAVQTTFVQFYPTLLPTAQAKNTLSPGYLADEAAIASGPKPN